MLSVETVNNIILPNIQWVKEQPKFKPVFEFEFKGVGYSMESSLLELQFGQFADVEFTLSKMNDGGESVDYMIDIPAILYVEKGKKYTGKQHGIQRELFQDLPMDIIFGIRDFFLTLLNLCGKDTSHFLDSLKARAKRLQAEMQHYLKSLDGTASPSHSLMTTSTHLIRLQSERLAKLSSI